MSEEEKIKVRNRWLNAPVALFRWAVVNKQFGALHLYILLQAHGRPYLNSNTRNINWLSEAMGCSQKTVYNRLTILDQNGFIGRDKNNVIYKRKYGFVCSYLRTTECNGESLYSTQARTEIDAKKLNGWALNFKALCIAAFIMFRLKQRERYEQQIKNGASAKKGAENQNSYYKFVGQCNIELGNQHIHKSNRDELRQASINEEYTANTMSASFLAEMMHCSKSTAWKWRNLAHYWNQIKVIKFGTKRGTGVMKENIKLLEELFPEYAHRFQTVDWTDEVFLQSTHAITGDMEFNKNPM